jgi:hypothetical protein
MVKRPSPTIIIAVIAIAITLTGTAFAALGKHSVGSRQLKRKAVTTKKLADNAVTGSKVKSHTLSGDDINTDQLGTVPNATNATQAGNVSAVTGHGASCPAGTTLIRALCYDNAPSGPVLGVKAASDQCAARGGFLPTVLDLITARGIIPLGDGNGVHSVFADSYYYDDFEPFTVVVNSSSQEAVPNEDHKTKQILANYEYVCVYQLVR